MRRKTGFSSPVIITDRPKAVLSFRFYLFYVRCRKTGFSSPVIITDRPKAYFRSGFICFMCGAVQFLNVLILTLLCVL